jgi:hypothetical protein
MELVICFTASLGIVVVRDISGDRVDFFPEQWLLHNLHAFEAVRIDFKQKTWPGRNIWTRLCEATTGYIIIIYVSKRCGPRAYIIRGRVRQ